MSIKKATYLGFIGAIVSIVLFVIYILLNLEIINVSSSQGYMIINVISNICNAFSSSTLAIFFYVLHKNQK